MDQDEAPRGRSTSEASDADSDLEELQGDIAKFDESVREFLASHHGGTEPPRATRGGPRGRGARGPRKAAKPRGDITARLSKVNQAFLGGDYSRALDLAFEVIRINAETHQAWTALASIFREQGELNRALSAMVYAAHLRPKDVAGWMRCASFALDTIEDDEPGNLHTARLCYSAALRADHANVDARLGKATVCHRQGHLSAAIAEYGAVLKRRPQDLDLVRKFAEACVDSRHTDSAVPSAITAYRHYFDHEIATQDWSVLNALWHDIGIYVELFATTGRYQEAVQELKTLSRWLVGRASEQYWDQWQNDDREWDEDSERRLSVPEFAAVSFSDRGDLALYGNSLPLDLRARLAIYRLRLGDESEALKHLSWLNPGEQHTSDFTSDFPFLVYDLAGELARYSRASLGVNYLEILRSMPGDPDPTLLLQLGRCYLAAGEQPAAEECFLAAIDADEESIDARVELANMYEKAKEDEEALILAAEAMALRDAQDPGSGGGDVDARPSTTGPLNRSGRRSPPPLRSGHRPHRDMGLAGSSHIVGRPMIPRRYRPKRLAGPDKRRRDEEARAVKLSRQFEIVRSLKQQISSGRRDLVPAWMASSAELFDDFRSLKKFYTWDKYLVFLDPRRNLEHSQASQPGSELSQMYERLARSLAPQIEQSGGTYQATVDTYQGISFENWLDLFLDYAIGLAIDHRRDEAYQVCEAARDSTVFQSPEHDFVIYVAWSVCAIYSSDEEKCVATARHLMRDGAITDSYRMFALLSSLCQSPISWYTSGPAQKYILRQIKALDAGHEDVVSRGQSTRDNDMATNEANLNLDICLLMLYGHILFTSTSYTYALSYFLRARALDASNAMVNLSLGLGYVHYGLKRQATNRQYLLLQGQAFMGRYAELCYETPGVLSPSEVYYNIGRLYQLLGVNYLAWDYYSQALQQCKEGEGDDIRTLTLVNKIVSLLLVQNKTVALNTIKQGLVL